MSEMKRCVQCGLLKSADEFRPYTYARNKETGGRFRICKACENINATYRRLCKQLDEYGVAVDEDGHAAAMLPMNVSPQKVKATWEAKEKIEKLYKTLEYRGLRVPANKYNPKPVVTEPTVATSVDQLMNFYAEEKPAPVITAVAPSEVPEELQRWLDADFQEWRDRDISPEYLQETVYESLKAKYRPQTGVDKNTYLPIYDDTYKDVLNRILRRFDDYEEEAAGVLEEELSDGE